LGNRAEPECPRVNAALAYAAEHRLPVEWFAVSSGALISMDSTLRSNISVGLPLDLLVYEADALRVTKFVQIDDNNQYMRMIRNTGGTRLKQVFQEIPDPSGRDAQLAPGAPRLETELTHPVRAPLPAALAGEVPAVCVFQPIVDGISV
jgi:putative proteasome-type protease